MSLGFNSLRPIDKAYREAVFHLESLRLRRNKIQASASEVSIEVDVIQDQIYQVFVFLRALTTLLPNYAVL